MENELTNTGCNLSLESIYFEELSFVKKTNQKTNNAFRLNMKAEFETCEKNKDFFSTILDLKICDKENISLSIRAIIVGTFKLSTSDSTLRDTLIEKNSVAILLPYLRSQISILTTQPGFKTILIPIVNVDNFNYRDAE